MLGIFEIHLGPPNEECNKVGLPKITELNLAYSRDGWHWHRPDRRAFIRAERRDVWDRGYVQPVGGICTIHGDTLWFYYTGFQGDPARKQRHFLETGMYDNGSTGVAFLRRDGFASMDADAAGGTLLTRPLTFSGTHLFVNADAAKGELRAELLDEAGNPIAPYTLDNCEPLSVDSTLAQVRWNGAGEFSSLAGKPTRIRFRLTNGSLYAFWISRDATGRSDGYLAAGGPGYTGMLDTVGRAALGDSVIRGNRNGRRGKYGSMAATVQIARAESKRFGITNTLGRGLEFIFEVQRRGPESVCLDLLH